MKACSTLILMLFQCIIMAQPNLEWSKNYGGSGDDIADQILTTSNGYFISGSTTSQDGDFVANPYDTAHFIMHLNEAGIVNWINFYEEEIIAIAKDRSDNLLFIKNADLNTIHIQKYNVQGTQIYKDEIISYRRRIIPKDLVMYAEGQIRIIGDFASSKPYDGLFSCNYNEIDGTSWFSYFPRDFTGAINNTIGYYVGIEEFYNTDMIISFSYFARTFEATYSPSRLGDACDFTTFEDDNWSSIKTASCSDGSILLECNSLVKILEDTVLTIEYNGPKKPLIGSKSQNWVYEQLDENFKILSVNNIGDSLYTLSYNGNGVNQIANATFSDNNGLALLINSNSSDLDFPINNGGQDIWVFKFDDIADTCITVAQLEYTTCPRDRFLLTPFIAGCSNCSYTWEDGSNALERWVEADGSRSFELRVFNNLDVDTTLVINLNVTLEAPTYEIEYSSECPAGEVKITFDYSSCSDCTIRYKNVRLDTNVVLVYPLKDEVLEFTYSLNRCYGKIEIPIDVYDFEAQVNHTNCGDSNFVEVLPIGGNGDITINWEDGSIEFFRNDLDTGFHSFILSDSLCSIGDSTSQTNILVPYPNSNTFNSINNDSIQYKILFERVMRDFINMEYYYFLIKFNNDIVTDFVSLGTFTTDETYTLKVTNDCIEVTGRWFSTSTSIYDLDLNLIEVGEPKPSLIQINSSDTTISRIENGDTIWNAKFENQIRGYTFFEDSTELIIYGRDLFKFVDFETGEILPSRELGGSEQEFFYDVVVRDERIYAIATTYSIDGDLQDLNFETSDFWIFEMDREQRIKWNHIYSPYASSPGNPRLDLFKEGFLVVYLNETTRYNSTGTQIWRQNLRAAEFMEDTIMFTSRSIYYDTYSENGIPQDSLTLNEDSSVTVVTSPGSMVLWSTGDTTSTITVSGPGTYTVQIESPDGCVTLDTIIVFARSVANHDIDLENHTIQVYPNPNNGEFILESEAKIQSIRIVNAMGKVMQEVQFPNGVNKHRINLNIDFAGLYIVQCQINNSWLNKKIITMNQ